MLHLGETGLAIYITYTTSRPVPRPWQAGTGTQSCQTLCNPMDYSQAPLSIGFSRQEYWNGLLFPPPGDLPNSGIEHASPVVPTLAGGFFTTEPPGRCHQAPHLSHWAQRLFLGPAHTACQLSHWLRVGRTTETSFSLLQNTQNLKVKQEFETKVYPEKLKA